VAKSDLSEQTFTFTCPMRLKYYKSQSVNVNVSDRLETAEGKRFWYFYLEWYC